MNSLSAKLSGEIAEIMKGVTIYMGSEASGTQFKGFFVASPAGSIPPPRIDEPLIRSRFGGTLFPLVTITVEPFSEDAPWWKQDILGEEQEIEPEELIPWRSMNSWFNRQTDFVDRAFVRIGDDDLCLTDEDRWPKGTELTGSVLPRLALGLTHKGSLVGLFGWVVYT